MYGHVCDMIVYVAIRKIKLTSQKGVVYMSPMTDESRLEKNKRIRATREETRKRRSLLTCKTYTMKVQENQLSKVKKDKLDLVFHEAKWMYNDIISHLQTSRLSSYDDKKKTVRVRMGRDSDEFEERKYSVLSASSRQALKSKTGGSLSSLKTLKRRGHRVGALKYSKEVRSVLYKQYRSDFSIDFARNMVRLTKIGSLKVRGLSQIPQDAEIAGNATLVRKPSGYYISIVVFEIPQTTVPGDGSFIGLDFGIKDSIVDSNGNKHNCSVLVSSRIRNLQRKLSRQKKGSRNYVKTLNKIKREYERASRKKDNEAEQLVSFLLGSYDRIYMQDENIKGWQSGLFGKQVQQSYLGRVKSLLINHPRVCVIERSTPTTQFCPECHSLNKISLSERIYSCDCGYKCDRDIHSARNMVIFGEKYGETHIKKCFSMDHTSTLVEPCTSG